MKLLITGIIGFSIMIWSENATLGSDFHSPRIAGLGGAGHAAPILNEAIYMNPSYGSFSPAQSISTTYQSFNGDPSRTERQRAPQLGRTYNVSVMDGRSPMFKAGVGYTVREGDSLLHVGAAKQILRRISMGLGAKFVLPKKGGNGHSASDVTLSASGIPTKWGQVSVIVDNVFQSRNSLRRNWHREITVGTKFMYLKKFMLYIDPHYVPDIKISSAKWGYDIGLEIAVVKSLFIRYGRFHNSTVPFQSSRGSGYGFGFGWIGPKISLDYGFYKAVSSIKDYSPASAHTMGGTIYF